MKRILSLLAIASVISCSNSQQRNNSTDTIDSVAIEKKVNVAESPQIEDTEITLNFSSYHLYTSEGDKYDVSGYQPVSASITIDEEVNKASLKLYDSGENKWYPFNFRIDEIIHPKDGVTIYTVYNNANKRGYIYVSTNRPGGLFVDINNFVFDGDVICCWMQESGSNGYEYRQGTVTIENTPNVESTPNTYTSEPSYSPNLNSGSIHSEEKIYGNYSNYEETDYCVEGVVVYEGNNDYYLVETRKGYTVLERYSGRLYEGDKVRGELNKYNFKYLINRNGNSEVKVYIDDYMLSDDAALEWLGKNKHLKSDDQRAYEANN